MLGSTPGPLRSLHPEALRLVCRIDPRVETEADAREERLAQNEVIFRGVNEAIEQKAIELGGLSEYDFICECSSTACVERISLTLREYEHVRRDGTLFFVRPGHEHVEVELVVETRPEYLIVQKDGAAGIIAGLEDPRSGDPGQ